MIGGPRSHAPAWERTSSDAPASASRRPIEVFADVLGRFRRRDAGAWERGKISRRAFLLFRRASTEKARPRSAHAGNEHGAAQRAARHGHLVLRCADSHDVAPAG